MDWVLKLSLFNILKSITFSYLIFCVMIPNIVDENYVFFVDKGVLGSRF